MRSTRLSRQVRHRSYGGDVVSAIERLSERFDVAEYGRLDYPPDHYRMWMDVDESGVGGKGGTQIGLKVGRKKKPHRHCTMCPTLIATPHSELPLIRSFRASRADLLPDFPPSAG
jgi:hypothetical protein